MTLRGGDGGWEAEPLGYGCGQGLGWRMGSIMMAALLSDVRVGAVGSLIGSYKYKNYKLP